MAIRILSSESISGEVLIASGKYLSWGTAGATSIEGSTVSNKLQFRTNSVNRMQIDSGGSIAVGNFNPSGTPAADYRSLEIGKQGNTITGAPWKSNLYFSTNATVTAGSTTFTYRALNELPTQMVMEDGIISFSNAVAPTAIGDTIAFTERMSIEVDGNVSFNSGLLELGNASSTPNIGYGMFHYSGIGLGIYSSAGGGTQGIGFWLNNGTAAYEAGRWLQNGNLGIGTVSPGAKLDVSDGTIYSIKLSNTAAYNSGINNGIVFNGKYTSGGSVTDMASVRGGKDNTTDGDFGGKLTFHTRTNNGVDTERMRITSRGEVGIGITPNVNSNVVNVIQLGKGMTLLGNANDDRATMAANLYLDTGTAFRYVMDGYAGRFSIEDGNMIWDTAGSGTLGTVATVSTKMTLLNNGNFGIGTTSPTNGKFVINQNSSAASFGGNICQLFENFNTTDGQMMSIGFRNNNSVGTTALIDAVAYDQSIGATDIRFSTYSGSAWNGNMVTFQHTGRVGIGTTSPLLKLHVVGEIFGEANVINGDTTIPNQNQYPESQIKISNVNDIYVKAVKTVISPYEANYANNGTGGSTMRLSTNTLVSGQMYTISVYYKDLVGSLTMDLGDTAINGNYKQAVGTVANPVSGRIYGSTIRNALNYNFVDVNLSSGGNVTLLNPKIEEGSIVTDFIATSATNAEPQDLTKNNMIITGSVGVGTPSPTATLDVHAPSTTAPSLTMGAAAGQIFKNEDSELAFGLNNASPYNVWMQSRFSGDTVRPLTINPLGGNIGIGTNFPAAMFDVLAGGSNYESIRIQNSKTANANKQAGITSLNYIGNSTSIFQYATNAGGNTVYYGSADGSFRGITQHSFMISSGADTVSHSTKLKILPTLINAYLDLYLIKGTPTIILEGRNFGNSGAKLQFLGWANTHDNWELGNAMAGQGFQFRASATAGSTNFATVAVINSNTGVYTATSDINKKKDFEDSEIGLKEVMKLKPKLFRMKTENGNSDKHLGFIAQEVKKVIPQAYLEENGENDEKFIGLQDRPIIAALTKAIQELKAEIELLKNK